MHALDRNRDTQDILMKKVDLLKIFSRWGGGFGLRHLNIVAHRYTAYSSFSIYYVFPPKTLAKFQNTRYTISIQSSILMRPPLNPYRRRDRA